MTNKLSASYLESVCQDGWWPYIAGHGESVEATAWCAIATRKNAQLARAAVERLINTQGADGGWSTAPETGVSDWSTAAALLAIGILHRELKDDSLAPRVNSACERGFKRLSGLRTDIITDVTRVGLIIMQGPEFDYPRGWPWEPDTYHWVEPTSYAILAVQSGPFATQKRFVNMVAQAHQYLLEKTCTAGGWNFGSPQTLGTDWPPLPSPTAMALIAMQNVRDPKVDKALSYLKGLTGPTIDSTIADSLAILARDVHGEDMAKEAPALAKRFASRPGLSENLCSIAAAAIASNLATDGNPFKFT